MFQQEGFSLSPCCLMPFMTHLTWPCSSHAYQEILSVRELAFILTEILHQLPETLNGSADSQYLPCHQIPSWALGYTPLSLSMQILHREPPLTAIQWRCLERGRILFLPHGAALRWSIACFVNIWCYYECVCPSEKPTCILSRIFCV